MGFSKKRSQRWAKIEKAKQEVARTAFENSILAYVASREPLEGWGDTMESLLAEGYNREQAIWTLTQQARNDFETRAEAHLSSLLGADGSLCEAATCWNSDTLFMPACEVTSGDEEHLSTWLTEELNQFAVGTPFKVSVCAFKDPAVYARERFENETVAYVERLLGLQGHVVDHCWNTGTILMVDCHVSSAAVPNDQLKDVTSWLNEEMDRFAGGTRYTVDVTVNNGGVQ